MQFSCNKGANLKHNNKTDNNYDNDIDIKIDNGNDKNKNKTSSIYNNIAISLIQINSGAATEKVRSITQTLAKITKDC